MDISKVLLTVIIVYGINLISIIIAVYLERKKTITAIVWILILTVLPLFGFILYFIFGRNLRPIQLKKFKVKAELDALYKAWIVDEKHIFDTQCSGILEKYEDIVNMNINTSGSIYSQDNDISIFTSAQDSYESMFKDINDATDTIHVLYYSINNDDIGNKFIELLSEKASKGVSIRLLYDHAGSWLSSGKLFDNLKKSGGKVLAFFPL